MTTQTRETDKKERSLVIVERHISDDINKPKFKTYFAKVTFPGTKKVKLIKVGNDYENESISVMRERAREQVNEYTKNGYTKLTLDDCWINYYEPYTKAETKEYKEIKRLYLAHIKPEFGHIVISKIKPDQLYKWFLELSAHSKGVANHCLTYMKAILNQAIKLNLIKNNPADKLSKNYMPSRIRYFTDEETGIFLAELKRLGKESPYGSAFIYLAYLTGARKGELAKATWNDLVGNTIVLREHKTDNKTNEPRVIYLNDEAMRLINNLPRDTETILKIKYPERQWKKLIKRTGIKNFRFHDLRHNFGTQGMNMGLNMISVGKLMGHSSIKAMQIYQHAKPELLQNDIKQIGQYLTN